MAFLKASCLPTLIFVLLLCNIRASDAQTPPLAEGLSYTFHQSSCPQLESIVRSQLQTELTADIGQAAGLLRLHFHDCFVLGCDGSVLLNGSASGPSEQSAPPNLTLRPRAFVIIENIRSLVHAACNATVSCSDITALAARDAVVLGCDASVLLDGSASGPSEKDAPPNLTLRAQAFVIIENLRRLVHNACNRTVSCADITALAARDAVFLSGGPNYSIPLGRRDGLTFATVNVTLANLPPPTANASFILESLSTKGFTPTDVVSLSGGHTIGIGHCGSFNNRIYPSRDPSMDQTFFNNLRLTCPTNTSNNTTVLDIRSPNVFDNKYYVDLMNRQGLFTSDQDLYTDSRTRTIVTNFAVNQTLFYQNFINAMIKMGQLNVLTGTQGEIRANCSRRNSNDLFILPTMENDQDEKVASY